MSYINKTNDISPKNSSAATGNKFSGNQVFWGSNNITHDSAYKPNTAPSESKREKKTKSLTNMFKTFAVMFSAVLMGSAGLGLISTSNINVTFNDVYAYGDCVSYYISLSSYEDGLSVVLYNDFTNREEQIEDSNVEIEGVFENLAPNMTYTLAVKKGTNVIAKKTIYLKQERDNYYKDTEPIYDKPNEENELNEREKYLSDEPDENYESDEPDEEPIEENENSDDPTYNSDKPNDPTYNDNPTNDDQNSNSNDPTYLDDNENGNPNEP